MADPSLCVYCRRQPVQREWRPFCSERCRLLDLARWIDGEYRIPGEAASVPAPAITGDTVTDTGDAVAADAPDERPSGAPAPRSGSERH